MASYSIVLNLTGNAVSQTERLAKSLAIADANANQLAARLTLVKSALAGMPIVNVPFSGGRYGGYGYGYGRRYYNGSSDSLYRRERDVNYTRHRSTRIASWGAGFNIGGFSGRLSTIIQPDVNGQIFGMDASRLMKGVNVASIATGIVTAVGKAVIKALAGGTIVQYGMGAGVNALFNRLLMSEGMTEGIRIIQRRNQARLGLGANYLQAQQYADDLASQYGLERSAAISSLNVLSGLRVGSGNQRITMSSAAALTRVGGLISQQAGVSFERVMTNIQQLMTQSNPNIRDIRELLNQAPILGRYALDEMERRGVQGVDKNTWLKDQANIMTVLQRYDVENQTSTVMQARGMVTMARQDFFAKIAENPDWLEVAGNVSDLMDSLAGAVSNLLSAFTNNTDFQNSVNALTFLVETIGTNATPIVNWTGKAGKFVADLFGIDVGEAERKSREYTQQRQTIAYVGEQYKEDAFQMFIGAGLAKSANPDVQRQQFETWYAKVLQDASRNRELLSNVELMFPAVQGGQLFSNAGTLNTIAYQHAEARMQLVNGNEARQYFQPSEAGSMFYRPNFAAYLSYLPEEAFAKMLTTAIEKETAAPRLGGMAAQSLGATGDDVRGFNRDRRSLEIHFHDAIVEWNSTITTDNPEDVLQEVSSTIEDATSRAIQIAILGASQKMNTNWY